MLIFYQGYKFGAYYKRARKDKRNTIFVFHVYSKKNLWEIQLLQLSSGPNSSPWIKHKVLWCYVCRTYVSNVHTKARTTNNKVKCKKEMPAVFLDDDFSDSHIRWWGGDRHTFLCRSFIYSSDHHQYHHNILFL